MGPSILRLIPARVRLWIYLAYAVVGFVVGAIPVAFAALDQVVPGWSLAATAVYALAGAYFGLQAAENVEVTAPRAGQELADPTGVIGAEGEEGEPADDFVARLKADQPTPPPGEHRRKG